MWLSVVILAQQLFMLLFFITVILINLVNDGGIHRNFLYHDLVRDFVVTFDTLVLLYDIPF